MTTNSKQTKTNNKIANKKIKNEISLLQDALTKRNRTIKELKQTINEYEDENNTLKSNIENYINKNNSVSDLLSSTCYNNNITVTKMSSAQQQASASLLAQRVHLEQRNVKAALHENKNLRNYQRSLEIKQQRTEDLAVCCSCYAIIVTIVMIYHWYTNQTYEKIE